MVCRCADISLLQNIKPNRYDKKAPKINQNLLKIMLNLQKIK